VWFQLIAYVHANSAGDNALNSVSSVEREGASHSTLGLATSRRWGVVMRIVTIKVAIGTLVVGAKSGRSNMNSIKLFLALMLIAGAGRTQSQDIEELVLWERSHHVYAEASKLLLVLNSGSELDYHLETELSDYLGGSFQFKNLNYANEDFDNYSESYAKIYLPIGHAMTIIVLNASGTTIENSRLLYVMTAFKGFFGAFELGIPFVDNSDNSWVEMPNQPLNGHVYQEEIYSSICSSFYSPGVFNPNESTTSSVRPPSGISATFFIESGPQSSSCFDRLFLDTIGLRGLAVMADANSQEVADTIKLLKTYENGHIFQVDN